MAKVLITGAAGFVASHLIPQLSSEFEVIGIGREPTISQDIPYFACDITNPQEVNQLIHRQEPEFIVHLAAIAHTTNTQFDQITQTNLTGPYNLYQAILSRPDYNPKILFISSGEVYGNTDTPDNITENSLLNPTNLYGVSKLAADRLSYQYALAHQLNITILRPFSHTGPGQQLGFFVPDIASQVAAAEKSTQSQTISTGNLTAIRDYLDVRDVVHAYHLALTTDLPPGESYNIASGQGTSIQSMFDQLISLSTVPITSQEDPNRLRPIDIPTLIGNSDKFRIATGWQPKIPLSQTLQDTLNYYRSL